MLSAVSVFLMVDLKEQNICVRFFFKPEETALETHAMLKTAFSENTTKIAQTSE
jgi:hypothetical protein